ncbi:uncharacterized protein LOC141660930 [Apium graveolens]|uniref:uncharacterized protein LOC141660930 n=1 Tax=Apium graveolens TaxID=4045 RepID=UPI003D7AF8CD
MGAFPEDKLQARRLRYQGNMMEYCIREGLTNHYYAVWIWQKGIIFLGRFMTPRSTTGESPFLLTYGYEAMVPVEVGFRSLRMDLFVEKDAEVNQRLHFDLLDEARMNSQLKLAAYQQRIARYFNKKVKSEPYKVGDLVLRKVMQNTKIAQHGVLGANWEGPYKVKAILCKGTYRLEDLDGKLIPRAWNAEH